MQKNPLLPFFLLLLAGAAIFIVTSSQSLPPVVASHFGAAGNANGFMSREFYVRFMLGLTLLLPLALVILPTRSLDRPDARINLPHRAYWLASSRRANTILYLRRQFTLVASLLLGFLCYVQWLVVRANTLQPPALPTELFFTGLGVFMLGMGTWSLFFVRHFRNLP